MAGAGEVVVGGGAQWIVFGNLGKLLLVHIGHLIRWSQGSQRFAGLLREAGGDTNEWLKELETPG